MDKYSRAVKDQGRCSSCWAFATYTSIEGSYKIKTGKSVVLGPQQLVDCDTSNIGCNGGWLSSSYSYAEQNGVALESDYPYLSGKTGEKNSCKYDKSKGLKIVTGMTQCPYGNCSMNTWVSMIQKGPIAVVVDMTAKEFQFYKSGIVDLTNCGQPNHSVTAVALLNANGYDYIKLLNSMSAGWGDKGYILVKYNAASDTCNITKTAWLPLVQENPSLAFNSVAGFEA